MEALVSVPEDVGALHGSSQPNVTVNDALWIGQIVNTSNDNLQQCSANALDLFLAGTLVLVESSQFSLNWHLVGGRSAM